MRPRARPGGPITRACVLLVISVVAVDAAVHATQRPAAPPRTDTGVGPDLLDVRSGPLTLRAPMRQHGKTSAVKIYPPFGRDARAGHNLIFESVHTWESDVFAFLDAHLRR